MNCQNRILRPRRWQLLQPAKENILAFYSELPVSVIYFRGLQTRLRRTFIPRYHHFLGRSPRSPQYTRREPFGVRTFEISIQVSISPDFKICFRIWALSVPLHSPARITFAAFSKAGRKGQLSFKLTSQSKFQYPGIAPSRLTFTTAFHS